MRALLVASVVGGGILLAARTAQAVPYEEFIDISDQTELDDLLASSDISQETYDQLLDILETGVNLNEATREELYSLPNLTYEDVDKILALRDLHKGVIADPADLVAAGAISQEKLLAISAFIITTPPNADPLALRGSVKLLTRWTYTDKVAPPMDLHARVTLLKHVEAGLAITTTRLKPGDPSYDPNRDALIADAPSYQFHVPKGFVKYEDDHYLAILGTYRVGFGQRLVFDTSPFYTPNGIYHDDQVYYTSDLDKECRESAGELATSPCAGNAASKYETPDFHTRNGLFGVGLGAKKIDLPTGWMQAYAWASYARRSIYQYELVNRATCEDPHDDMDPGCAAPTVFTRPGGDILDPTSRFAFQTLPDVFAEKLVGGNISYFADRRDSVGLTAYGADETNLVNGVDLDFQEWSKYPYGRKFGAAGANFNIGRGPIDVSGEAAISFDKMSPETPPAEGGGGPAAILRVTATRKHEELETSLRYYDTDYVNPYAGSIAQSDELDGQRARDEMGARVRYVNTQKLFTIRALADLWVPPSTLKDGRHKQPKLDTYIRADVRTSQELWLGLWERYQDKDLNASGHDLCFEIPSFTTDMSELAEGQVQTCQGRQLTTIARAKYIPAKNLQMTLMLEHQLLDDPNLSKTSFRQDFAAWFIGLWTPTNDVRLRARLRYRDDAIEDSEYLERSFSAVIEGIFKIRNKDVMMLRYDMKFWLDDRDSTGMRDPNPEATFWLSYEAKL
jgi:hypothetical protein